jgi:hypothetical protein
VFCCNSTPVNNCKSQSKYRVFIKGLKCEICQKHTCIKLRVEVEQTEQMAELLNHWSARWKFTKMENWTGRSEEKGKKVHCSERGVAFGEGVSRMGVGPRSKWGGGCLCVSGNWELGPPESRRTLTARPWNDVIAKQKSASGHGRFKIRARRCQRYVISGGHLHTLPFYSLASP